MTTGSTATSIASDVKPRKERKRSPRPHKTHIKRPGLSKVFKTLWADPVWAAKQRERMARHNRERASDKTKRFSRVGIPDGMRKEEAEQIWAQCRTLGKRFIKIMEDNNEVELVPIPGSEAEMAKRALEEAFVMAVSPISDAKTKSTNIRTVLEWTKSKPESKSKLTLNKAEEWLAEIAQDMPQDDVAD